MAKWMKKADERESGKSNWKITTIVHSTSGKKNPDGNRCERKRAAIISFIAFCCGVAWFLSGVAERV
jgi:hypothetical protein